MNPVKPQNPRWEEIRKHGLFGRQLEPVFTPQNGKWIGLAGLAILGITFYWMFTYTGPYRYLAELQLKWFGSYYPNVTCLLVFSGLIFGSLFGLLGLVVTTKFLFHGAESLVPGMPTAPAAIPDPIIPALQMVERWRRNVLYGALYGIPLVVFGIGAYAFYNGTREGDLQQLTAADFQSGKLQARLVYADVRGHLSDQFIDKESYLYFAMTSEEKTASPVPLLVGVGQNDTAKYLHREADGTYTVRGVADKGLIVLRQDSDVKYAFEKIGIALADPVWVVRAGRNPSDDRMVGLSVMGGAIVFGGLAFAWLNQQKRKWAAAQAVQATV
jgi:hypothetical protein